MRSRDKLLTLLPLVLLPTNAMAAEAAPDLTTTGVGLLALAVFAIAYLFVIAEEVTGLRKSIPVVLAAGIVWVLVAIAWRQHHESGAAEVLRENLLEYGELFLFLLAAMTYVNTLQERNVFAALGSYLIACRLSLRAVFWITGAMAFLLSPVLDNLTTGVALMGQARGIYTFFAHLKWAWAIALGYATSIWVHFIINSAHF